MSLLERAVETIESWGPERKKDRAQCTKLFAQISKRLDRAITIWNDFLDKAPESGDRFTTVLWIGAKPAKKLQALYLDNKATAITLTELTGVRFKDSLSLNEELDVVQAYEQLGPEETGSDRARTAIRLMTERKERIDAAVAGLGG
ncbi:MAG: hypothetical protein GTO67_13785 [Gammaproteobacteria bacterium]|nr:hypothetical protein [Gammaproteobacteria bacterium]NIN39639.1 hypothetical protein [Gammaproteobacteria bacterium]NIO25196.1 hypothetical protein [Gammaproteobacteria bacterium]NIO65825.1 hypothetical protein [Gammaproteobacteria bacterium]NIP45736.1 hypothetical protein [Gammaproteobacteria bacterium]